MAHEKDSDCTLDPKTDVCLECGVWHVDPCAACGGRGFHKPDCELESELESELDQAQLRGEERRGA